MAIHVLTAPGLGSSGPQHWQTLWEQIIPGSKRIEQTSWDAPVCAAWVAHIEREVAAAGPRVVIVAHSLACIAVAHWAAQTKRPIAGALLVAPPDAERPGFPPEAQGFTPIPNKLLPFKSIVVASTNDEYCSLDRATYFATTWGSRFVNLGAKGHINALSNLGEWPEGLQYLRELLPAGVKL
ncbi:alpha/beta hydrolase [Chitinophaga sp. sic0106]|uniref:RBBP9/YdeN family alpha/beta hydrolase n=1 Tax=Chitinophaga sp. sic0106 TaxID=2854785 RepID=UPI001C48D573|nr:alpha/beta fold hydrolase [Chitinophaga sp. sic0106]MBV7531474.1 alpha/beta fold hydrolase [Chitinophaga sp. sic0106]